MPRVADPGLGLKNSRHEGTGSRLRSGSRRTRTLLGALGLGWRRLVHGDGARHVVLAFLVVAHIDRRTGDEGALLLRGTVQHERRVGPLAGDLGDDEGRGID